MPAELVHAVADADREAVGPAKAGAVATRAGLRRSNRDARIEVELLAECRLFRCVGIFLRERNRRRPLVLRLQRVEAGGCGLAEIDTASLADDRSAERDGGEAENTETGCNGRGKQHRSRGNEFSHAKQTSGVTDYPHLNSTNAARLSVKIRSIG